MNKNLNKIAKFLATPLGRRVLNVAYSWGAAVVIIGALFKLLHWPFGDEMLFVGMITEFFVFFISGFERTEENYQWERVFPELKNRGNISQKEREERRLYLTEKAEEARQRLEEPNIAPTENRFSVDPAIAKLIPEEQVVSLSNSIKRLGTAVDQLARLGELTANMTQQWESFNLENEDLQKQTKDYQEYITSINKNLQGLDIAYENQLKDITEQVNSIEKINQGLDQIRQMYDSSLMDSNLFRIENNRMARQLQDLNMVYARLLDAMTVSMQAPVHSYSQNRYSNSYSSSVEDAYNFKNSKE